MKKLLVILIIGVLAGLAWLIWFRPANHDEAETKVEPLVTVNVGKIERTTLRAYITAYGVVEPEPPGARPAASARVTPTVGGVVTAVQCAEGQRVERGAVLVLLDNRLADAAVAFAQKNFERQKTLLTTGGASQKTMLEAEQQWQAAQIQRNFLEVHAPLAGVVTRLNVKPGEAVDLTTTLAEIVDLDHLVVSANVPSAELAMLHTGALAEVRFDFASAPVKGILNYISPQLDAKTGTAEVRVTLPTSSGLRLGQVVTVRIVSAEHKDCLAVPEAAVVKDAESGETVIALVQGEQAAQKVVTAGLRDGGLVEVTGEGLLAGQPVVTQGAYGLPKKTKVRITKP